MSPRFVWAVDIQGDNVDKSGMTYGVDIETFLGQRHAMLRRRLAELQLEAKKVEAELCEVEKAAAAINITIEIDKHSQKQFDQENSVMTMKQAAAEILEGATGGLTTLEILEIMNDKLGTKYARSSLSPQMSRLRGDGVVDRVGGRWQLTRYLKEKPAPE